MKITLIANHGDSNHVTANNNTVIVKTREPNGIASLIMFTMKKILSKFIGPLGS